MKKIRALSACLAGLPCRYDGCSKGYSIYEYEAEQGALLLCPEELGGLDTPRIAAEIVGGSGYDVLNGKAKVINSVGVDVTKQFVLGAYRALAMVQSVGVSAVVLKQNSPSCGTMYIYDGTFQKQLVPHMGVSAALLKIHGYDLYDEQTGQKNENKDSNDEYVHTYI